MKWIRLFFTFLLLLNFFLGWRLFAHEEGLRSYKDLQSRRNALLQQIATIEEVNLDLSHEIRRLTTDHEYVESVIRVEMHYLHPNEVLYIPQHDPFRRTP
jgi:cell division protein FtsB